MKCIGALLDESWYIQGGKSDAQLNVINADIEFLATKYIKEESLKEGGNSNHIIVDYSGFLRDYDQVEQKGLGAGVHEAFITDRFTIRAFNARTTAA